jgi:hypothetical protein
LVILMHEPTRRPELTRRASPREAAPPAAQWACCMMATTGSPAMHPLAWQVTLYQFAREQAVKSVEAARLRAHRARWN